jgi:DNA-binding GntR family transcriptional regulator
MNRSCTVRFMQDAAPGWQSVKRRSLADEVTDQLRDMILAGGLQPGERVGEAEISQRLRVSRGPVREALVRLEQEGLVASEWHRGATVTDLTRVDVIELATLRGALEKLAIAGACRSATEEDLAAIQDVVERMRAASASGTDQALGRLDIEFHDAVYRAAHHERLYAAWTTIRSQAALALLRRRVVNADYPGLVVDEHAALAVMIADRNPGDAEVQIVAHIEGAYSRLLAAYDNSDHASSPSASA